MESETKNPKTLSRIKWQWKSNSDPFSKTEEPKWTSYSPEHNYLIEKAYYDKRKEVDLGDYIVSIEHKIQKKKGMVIRQRPIRRIESEDDEIDVRSERYFDTELPKSTNKIFGSLWHFINFFSKRNLEIFDLAMQLHISEPLNDLDELNTRICSQLIHCLKEELLKPIEDDLKNDSISELQKKIIFKRKKRHEELISLFQKEFTSFEEFYGHILRSYTMNTDLYLNLNKYLRNESWTAIDKLLPYVICLCKAFFSLKFNISNLQKTEGSITLYRGTALDEFALSSYQTQKASKHFSWNSVTSTSTKREMAENFMYDNVDLKNKKFPVMFIIEIPFVNGSVESESLKWIDIHRFSALPKENEVILVPGCAFELVAVSTEKANRTTINLKLKHEIESLAHEGLIMQGLFQTEMMDGPETKIVCQGGEELVEALKNLAGNRLIEEVEFSLCTFDNKSLNEMLDTLPTLEKARRLKFVCCKYEDEEGISSIRLKKNKNCNILEVEIFEVQDFSKIFNIQKKDDDYWNSLKKINIYSRSQEQSVTQKRVDVVLHRFQHFTYLTNIALDFSGSEIKDERESQLASKKLEKPTQLNSLNLTFAFGSTIGNNGLKGLASQGFKYFTKLTSLSLNFAYCSQITDKGMKTLTSQILKHLTRLTSLDLNFTDCSEITNKGLKNLASQGLKYLTQLTSLNLDFTGCSEITDEGVNALTFYGLKFRTQLTSLALCFSYCSKITYQGVNNIASKALQYLTQLTSLTLRLFKCEITDEGLSDLSSKGLKYLSQLTSLVLYFDECSKITDEGVSNLASQGLYCLLKLVSLALHFSHCSRITDKGVNALAFQGLKFLDQLNSLTLNFYQCSQITDEGVSNLAFKGLQFLTQITSLALDFSYCSKITDQGMNSLAFRGLNGLLKLVSLVLRFSHCSRITDKGVTVLASQALKFLTQLNSLILDFYQCSKITNKGVSNLASEGLYGLIKLVSLALSFSQCSKITDEGMNALELHGLKSLTQITSLALDFSCSRVTNQGVNRLVSWASKNLTQLTSLIIEPTLNHHQTNHRSNKNTPNPRDIKLTRKRPHDSIKSFEESQQVTNLSPKAFDPKIYAESLELSEQSQESISDFLFSLVEPQWMRETSAISALNRLDSSDQVTPWEDSPDKDHFPDLELTSFHDLFQIHHFNTLARDLSYGYQRKLIDEGLKNFESQGIEYLTNLASLTLNFSHRNQRGDEGAALRGLKYLTQLVSLNLEFYRCSNTTDEGLTFLRAGP